MRQIRCVAVIHQVRARARRAYVRAGTINRVVQRSAVNHFHAAVGWIDRECRQIDMVRWINRIDHSVQ